MYCYFIYNGWREKKDWYLEKHQPPNSSSFSTLHIKILSSGMLKPWSLVQRHQFSDEPAASLSDYTVPQDSKSHAHCHKDLQAQNFEMCYTFHPTYRRVKCYLSHLSYHIKANQTFSTLSVVGDTCYIL